MKNRQEEKAFFTDKKLSKYLTGMMMILFCVVLLSTMMFLGFSQRETKRAVQDVSEFYLKEVSANVNQVFTTHFSGYFKELRLALMTTRERSFQGYQNEAELAKHLQRMVSRGDFLYYGLMDEDGEIYLSDEQYRSDVLEDFMHSATFEGDEITIEKRTDADDIFIIAASTEEISMNGKKIIAGVKGISESKVKREILFRSGSNKNYANIIQLDGTYVIAGDNKRVVKGNNYFEDLAATAEFLDGDSLEDMIQRLQEGQEGEINYVVDGVPLHSHYSVLPRSGWGLVVTMEVDIVGAMMDEATTHVTLGGLALMLLMIGSMGIMFYLYVRQARMSVELNLGKIEAEERSNAKSSFLSSMSHDIRTPMNAIIGFTNLALQQPDCDGRVREYLGKIRVSSNHLLSLINDVLDMSRIESGKMRIAEDICDLAEIFHGLHTIIQGQVQEKKQNLYMDVIDVENETVWCDKVRLNQVLLNFLSNAVKFTPTGGTISVIVSQKASQRPGYGQYQFRVKDTGIGMTKEFKEKIFEPFERDQTVTVNGIQGTGLGMSIAKSIVDMMGGTIRVETEIGKGTEFIVDLELRQVETTEADNSTAMDALKGMRAMVIADEASTCDSVMKMLHSFGMEPEWTMEQDAIGRLKQGMELGKAHEIFVVDCQHPESNDFGVIRQIRSVIGPVPPILLMSSYNWDSIIQESREAGASDFSSKPIFKSELRAKLLGFVGKSGIGEQEFVTVTTQEEFEGKRILLVDDNELNREIATEILLEYGFDVATAENGKIAVEMVEEADAGCYEVILMDVQMPVMNGYEAARAIRKLSDPAKASITILAMTANAFEEDKQLSHDAGMDGHLTKPIDVDVLLEVLKEKMK